VYRRRRYAFVASEAMAAPPHVPRATTSTCTTVFTKPIAPNYLPCNRCPIVSGPISKPKRVTIYKITIVTENG